MHNMKVQLRMMSGQLILCSGFYTSRISGNKQFLSTTAPGIWALQILYSSHGKETH